MLFCFLGNAYLKGQICTNQPATQRRAMSLVPWEPSQSIPNRSCQEFTTWAYTSDKAVENSTTLMESECKFIIYALSVIFKTHHHSLSVEL